MEEINGFFTSNFFSLEFFAIFSPFFPKNFKVVFELIKWVIFLEVVIFKVLY